MNFIVRSMSLEVACNVNKFCVYVLASSFYILSNFADTINKPKTTSVDFYKKLIL